MHIMLDDEQWTVEDGVSLMEILAQVSDKAYAKQRVITSLQLGERELTDRDLTGAMLAQLGNGIGPVRAMTQSMDQVMKGADRTVERYAGLLKADGASLAQDIRTGQMSGGSLDAWLGRLADYLECIAHQPAQTAPHSPTRTLALWVSRLLDARLSADWIALADLIEYEIVTRLPG
jgi:hypothetical protein